MTTSRQATPNRAARSRKNVFTAFVGATILASMLAGCGSTATKPDEVTKILPKLTAVDILPNASEVAKALGDGWTYTAPITLPDLTKPNQSSAPLPTTYPSALGTDCYNAFSAFHSAQAGIVDAARGGETDSKKLGAVWQLFRFDSVERATTVLKYTQNYVTACAGKEFPDSSGVVTTPRKSSIDGVIAYQLGGVSYAYTQRGDLFFGALSADTPDVTDQMMKVQLDKFDLLVKQQ